MCGIVGLVLFFLVVPSVVALVLGLGRRGARRAAPAARAPASGGRWPGGSSGAVGVVGFVAIIVGAVARPAASNDDVSVHRLDVADCVDLAGDSEPSDVADRLLVVTATSPTTPRCT